MESVKIDVNVKDIKKLGIFEIKIKTSSITKGITEINHFMTMELKKMYFLSILDENLKLVE